MTQFCKHQIYNAGHATNQEFLDLTPLEQEYMRKRVLDGDKEGVIREYKRILKNYNELTQEQKDEISYQWEDIKAKSKANGLEIDFIACSDPCDNNLID